MKAKFRVFLIRPNSTVWIFNFVGEASLLYRFMGHEFLEEVHLDWDLIEHEKEKKILKRLRKIGGV